MMLLLACPHVGTVTTLSQEAALSISVKKAIDFSEVDTIKALSNIIRSFRTKWPPFQQLLCLLAPAAQGKSCLFLRHEAFSPQAA
jgi:hypothetical protein